MLDGTGGTVGSGNCTDGARGAVRPAPDGARGLMHGLVLAGGEGSRLGAPGVTVPRALVQIGGRAQVARMVAACRRVGCEMVTCAVREDLAPAVRLAIA